MKLNVDFAGLEMANEKMRGHYHAHARIQGGTASLQDGRLDKQS